MKRLLFLSVCTYLSLVAGTNIAAAAGSVQQLSGAWGGGVMGICKQHAFLGNGGNACIGATSNCNNIGLRARQGAGNSVNASAFQMLVAVDVREHGAKFCPVQIEANRDADDTCGESMSLQYAKLMEGDNGCVWLCKSGYSGDGCMAATTTSCDTAKLDAAAYSGIRADSARDDIRGIPTFDKGDRNCYSEEMCGGEPASPFSPHEMILAVSRWTQSGHGAFVRQMVVSAARQGTNNPLTYVNVFFASKAGSAFSPETLVCKNGYKPNGDSSDCVAADPKLCPQEPESPPYDTQTPSSNSGSRQCGSGQAYEDDNKTVCIPCTGLHNGIVNDVCKQCGDTGIFNKKTNKCATVSVKLSKTDMLYGKDHTKYSKPNVLDQCWSIADSAKYKTCVLGR